MAVPTRAKGLVLEQVYLSLDAAFKEVRRRLFVFCVCDCLVSFPWGFYTVAFKEPREFRIREAPTNKALMLPCIMCGASFLPLTFCRRSYINGTLRGTPSMVAHESVTAIGEEAHGMCS